MRTKPDERRSLRGYSELMNFQHTPEELVALETRLREMNEEIERLWQIDVEDVGLAYFFDADWDD